MRDSVQHRDVKSEILDAAERLMAAKGYKKMTIEDLANEVGIGKGSVYLHFSSKEEIALSQIGRIIERLKDKLAAIAAERMPADERLRRMLAERVLYRFDSVQDHTRSLNDMFASIRPRLLELRERYFEEEAGIFAEVVRQGSDAGIFLKKEPIETARTLLIATNSLLPYSLSVKELGSRADIESKTLALAELLLNGVMAEKRPDRSTTSKKGATTI